ncbi:MAG: TRIC cation channel family protein [Lachnospiraceae bacterium]|nr:TRIC cation channel family protein [Lachnospiraceae bacterium]
MEFFLFFIEVIGTIAFAVSGAMTAIRKNMDAFGVAVLGLTTAVGGGMVRDLILGSTPPAMFQTPVYAMIAVGTTIVVFVFAALGKLNEEHKHFDQLMFWMDTLGLGVFSVLGVEKAIIMDTGCGLFLMVFVGVLTGVGGGLLRDIFAGNTPYIFVKHVYASASIAGALVCALLYDVAGERVAVIIGAVVVVVIRCLAAHYRWSLPKVNRPVK